MRYAVWRLPGSGESSAQLSRGASLSTHGTSSRCSQRSATACMGDFLSEPIVERCHDYRARGARRPGEEWAAGGGAMGAAARSADPPRALVPVLAGASLLGSVRERRAARRVEQLQMAGVEEQLELGTGARLAGRVHAGHHLLAVAVA